MFFHLNSDSIPQHAGQKKYWGNLHAASSALAIVELAEKSQKSLLIVCPNNQQAYELEQEVRFFKADLPLLNFPDWEVLPYDHFSPHHDIISDRLRCLYQLSTGKQAILFISINTLMQRIAPIDYIKRQALQIKIGDKLSIAQLRRQCEAANYQCVSTVYEHGEFAVRGSIIDIFPMGSDTPYRIELFDVDVEKIKTFSSETQLTIENVQAIDILPAFEFPFDAESLELFKDNWYQHFTQSNLKECYFYPELNKRIHFPGIEFYLPLFFQQTASLLDYFTDAIVINHEGAEQRFSQHWQDINQRYQQYGVDKYRPLLKPEVLYFSENQFFEQLNRFPRVILSSQARSDAAKGYIQFSSEAPGELVIDSHNSAPYAALKNYLGQCQHPVLFCAESLGRQEALQNLFNKLEVNIELLDNFHEFIEQKPAMALTVADIRQGLKLPGFEIITENQLFGQRVSQARRRKKATQSQNEHTIKSLTELNIGDAVVHIDHGIGRYTGLKSIEIDRQTQEFLCLCYADNALLYVPVTSLHLISRFSAAENENVHLHKLGTDKWSRAKEKAQQQIHDVAAELLAIYAKRAAQKGFSYQTFTEAYEQFAASFAFEETADQSSAIASVLEDMAKDRPMDRLVCGDVGFGKTEVAMRAAFTAAFNGKQVAILVPTTLLAQQHYESFVDRFAKTPIRIEVLSRFRTAQEQKAVLTQLEKGQIDILIGTHKLLQKDVQFKELGLVIIDEEHRFGVKQKEALKALRTQVDILALTATPIPRTLNMSMAGMRDLSVISTPPAKRLSIKTFVHKKEDSLIKEAILRELLRGGQVYYLHNEVKTIENAKKELEKLIPEARIGIGHGQMRERELERVMSDFYHARYNILLCSTIIETGIDVPNANTIIIERADMFGLAQLHQLRGRVGRSHHQAYAYLLTPAHKKESKDAEKRLEAISMASDLGAGFTLATHDLEIRGAGELLGDEQSGQIQTLGFSLYMEMLERAVKAIQRGESFDLDNALQKGTEINLGLPAIITEQYVGDVQTRLSLYKRIADCSNQAQLDDERIAMIDRFGLLPEQTKTLFAITALKLRIENLGILRIEANKTGGKFEFSAKPNIDPMLLVKLVQSSPVQYRLEGSTTLRFKQESDTAQLRIDLINTLIDRLTGKL